MNLVIFHRIITQFWTGQQWNNVNTHLQLPYLYLTPTRCTTTSDVIIESAFVFSLSVSLMCTYSHTHLRTHTPLFLNMCTSDTIHSEFYMKDHLMRPTLFKTRFLHCSVHSSTQAYNLALHLLSDPNTCSLLAWCSTVHEAYSVHSKTQPCPA